jgi:hypothetical protein
MHSLTLFGMTIQGNQSLSRRLRCAPISQHESQAKHEQHEEQQRQ